MVTKYPSNDAQGTGVSKKRIPTKELCSIPILNDSSNGDCGQLFNFNVSDKTSDIFLIPLTMRQRTSKRNRGGTSDLKLYDNSTRQNPTKTSPTKVNKSGWKIRRNSRRTIKNTRAAVNTLSTSVSDTQFKLRNQRTSMNLTRVTAVKKPQQLERIAYFAAEETTSKHNSSKEIIVIHGAKQQMLRKIPTSNFQKAFHTKNSDSTAFEKWKQNKTKAYRRLLKTELRKKEDEKATKTKEIEKKRAANEAYFQWRNRQATQKKLNSSKNRFVTQPDMDRRQQSAQRRIANSRAFKAWKKQKDIQLRERKMYMKTYNQRQGYKNHEAKTTQRQSKRSINFNTWLDQLDCILHQKYLRERRYLVHSFYCHPAYFGSAAICGK